MKAPRGARRRPAGLINDSPGLTPPADDADAIDPVDKAKDSDADEQVEASRITAEELAMLLEPRPPEASEP